MVKYDSYKDSGVEWIGDIPIHWDKTKLNRFIFFQEGPGLRTFQFTDDGVKVICVTNITEKGIDFTYKKFISEQEYVEKYQHFTVNKGDLLLSSSGNSWGKVSEYKDDEKVILNTSTIRLNTKDSKLFYKDLIKYILKSEFVRIQLDILMTGSCQPNFGPTHLDQLYIPIQTLSEQNQIVKYLDEKTTIIDTLINRTQQKIETLKELRSSLINRVVTKGLDPKVEMKDSGDEWIGKIPKHWNFIPIKFLVTTKVTDGPHETPEFLDEGIPFLSVESVQDNKLDFNKKRGYISQELHEIYSKKCKPQKDDVFIVKSGSTTGKSTIVDTDEDFNIWSPLCIIRSDKSKILPKFTCMSIQSGYFRRFIELGWSFGTQPNIGMGVIENIRLIVPSLIEQNLIINYLDEQTQLINTSIQKEQLRIEKLKEYRQSLISDVVTGKIKVTDYE